MTNTTRVHSLYLTILLMSISISILCQMGDNPLSFLQYVYASSLEHIFSPGEPIVLDYSKTRSLSGAPVRLTWTQINVSSGNSVLGYNGTYQGPILSVEPPPVSTEQQNLTFNLTATTGSITNSQLVYVVIEGHEPPIIDAGPNRTIDKEDLCINNNTTFQVPLNSTISKNSENISLKHKWQQLSGPNVTISNSTNQIASINLDSICALTQTSDLVYSVSATDPFGFKDSDTVNLIVNVNQIPVAKITGPDSVRAGDDLILNGSASSDPDGNITAYKWYTGISNGSMIPENATVIGNTSVLTLPTSNYTANTNISLPILLRVQDNDSAYSEVEQKTVRVLPNFPPVADAGPNRTIDKEDLCLGNNPNQSVLLNANNTKDPANETLTYKWQQLSGPNVTISNSTNQIASINLDSICALTQTSALEFMATAIDPEGLAANDTVNLIVNVNQIPVAKITGPDSVRAGDDLILNGSASSDPDGNITAYKWYTGISNGSMIPENATVIGNTSVLTLPTSNYTANTNISLPILLRVQDNDSAYSEVEQKTVRVLPNFPPVADEYPGIGPDADNEYPGIGPDADNEYPGIR